MTWAEQVGLGELELAPWDFWSLTPRELQVKLNGLYRREDRAWQKVATLGVWVLSPHVSKRAKLSVGKLLGRQLDLFPRLEP